MKLYIIHISTIFGPDTREMLGFNVDQTVGLLMRQGYRVIGYDVTGDWE